MTGLLIALIFVSIAAVTAFIGMNLWNWRARAIDRIAAPTEIITPFLPSPSLVWQELVKRIGTHVPAASKDLPLLRRRLVRRVPFPGGGALLPWNTRCDNRGFGSGRAGNGPSFRGRYREPVVLDGGRRCGGL